MAGEIQVPLGVSGRDVYAVMRNSNALVANTGSEAFENYTTANFDEYVIPLNEQGVASGYYVGDFPSWIPAGIYGLLILQQLGLNPVETDAQVGRGNIEWTGTMVASLGVLMASANDGALAAHVVSYSDAATPANSVLNGQVEIGFTVLAILQVLAATAAGKSSGGPASPVFKSVDDSRDCVSGTADQYGNRLTTEFNTT
jgi:hypothetical protein